jgi:hypothetical protein
VISRQAKDREYPATTSWISPNEAFRFLWIEGIATRVIVVSRICMYTADRTITRTSQRPEMPTGPPPDPSDTSVAGGCSAVPRLMVPSLLRRAILCFR